MMTQKNRYPTDVTNTQWLFIQQLLTIAAEQQRGKILPKGRRRSTELRHVINAINYRWKTGCTWRMLPHDFPKWETVYTYFRQWRDQGLLPRLREVMIMKKYPKIPQVKNIVGDDVQLKMSTTPHEKMIQHQPVASSPEFNGVTPTNLFDEGLRRSEVAWPTNDIPQSILAKNDGWDSQLEGVSQERDKLDPLQDAPDGFQRRTDVLRS